MHAMNIHTPKRQISTYSSAIYVCTYTYPEHSQQVCVRRSRYKIIISDTVADLHNCHNSLNTRCGFSPRLYSICICAIYIVKHCMFRCRIQVRCICAETTQHLHAGNIATQQTSPVQLLLAIIFNNYRSLRFARLALLLF